MVPRHIRKGIIRLYLLTAVPWLLYFGYVAIDADREYRRAFKQFGMRYAELIIAQRHALEPPRAEKPITSKPRGILDLDEVLTVDDAKLNLERVANKSGTQKQRRDFALSVLPLLPVGEPIIFLAILWVVAGFRKRLNSN